VPDRDAFAHDLGTVLRDGVSIVRVRISDSETRPDVRAGERVDRKVESVAGSGTGRSEKGRGSTVRGSRQVCRPIVIPEHVKDAGIELQASIQQAIFCAGFVAPQCVLVDECRRLWYALNEYRPRAARSVSFCGGDVEELMLGGLIREPELRQDR
jgi:hypothetical protein